MGYNHQNTSFTKVHRFFIARFLQGECSIQTPLLSSPDSSKRSCSYYPPNGKKKSLNSKSFHFIKHAEMETCALAIENHVTTHRNDSRPSLPKSNDLPLCLHFLWCSPSFSLSLSRYFNPEFVDYTNLLLQERLRESAIALHIVTSCFPCCSL